MTRIFILSSLFAASLAAPSHASTPRAYAALDRQTSAACIAASGLRNATIGAVVRFSDNVLMDARVVTGTYPQPKGTLMKMMTCKQLGGKRDQELSADTWDQMVKAMTKHVMDKHPDVAKEMEKMHNVDPKKWGQEMKLKWDATVED